MYKITKTINDYETINLVFDDVALAKETFRDLQYDEWIRFDTLYGCGVKKETREEKIDKELIYREYKFSVSTVSVTITLTYVKD